MFFKSQDRRQSCGWIQGLEQFSGSEPPCCDPRKMVKLKYLYWAWFSSNMSDGLCWEHPSGLPGYKHVFYTKSLLVKLTFSFLVSLHQSISGSTAVCWTRDLAGSAYFYSCILCLWAALWYYNNCILMGETKGTRLILNTLLTFTGTKYPII